MSEAVITAIIAGAVTIGGIIGKLVSDWRSTNLTEALDDRKALRTFYETELALCRKQLEQEKVVKDHSISVLERVAAELEARATASQQTGGTP